MNNEQSKEEPSYKSKGYIEKQIQRVIRHGKELRRRRLNSMRCGSKAPRR